MLFTCTYQVKAKHVSVTFSVLFEAHFELSFVPETIFVVGCKGFFGSAELCGEGGEVDEVLGRKGLLATEHLLFALVWVKGRDLSVQIVELSFYFLVNWLINFYMLLMKMTLIMVVYIIHHMVVHGDQFSILIWRFEARVVTWEMEISIVYALSCLIRGLQALLHRIAMRHHPLLDGVTLFLIFSHL